MGYSLGFYLISIYHRDQCANLGFGRFIYEGMFLSHSYSPVLYSKVYSVY